MAFSNSVLRESLTEYSYLNAKLVRDVKSGKLARLKRGLYETDLSMSGYLLASSLYGPSYLSFDYALYYYDLIPEKVVVYTCATYNKKKKKRFDTYFGTFTYRDVPKSVYSLGLKLIIDGDYAVQIATPEKALCDKLYTLRPYKNIESIKNLLLNDLRIKYQIHNGTNVQIFCIYQLSAGGWEVGEVATTQVGTLPPSY